MLEVRAERVRREVAAVAGSGVDVARLHGRAIELVGHTMRSELTCWALIDPVTLTISSMTRGPNRVPSECEPLLAESEYGGRDPGSFAALARSGPNVVRASDLPATAVAGSLRHGAVWRPLGMDREIRVVFRIDGMCWGGAGFVRSGPDFTDRDVEFLSTVAPALAAATRAAVRDRVRPPADGGEPAVVVTDAAGDPIALTAAARSWRDRLDEADPGRLPVLLRIATAGARSSSSGVFRARVRDASGGWVLVRATALLGGEEGRTVVTVEPATDRELTDLVFAACALTTREREVCADVMTGHSTRDIAERRGFTPNTVHDHLKSVYAKTGVRSRAELVARLRPGRRIG
ncbi:helix-turn-helix transcriptional regulator [Rhodococcus gannanensis]|uniref:LuxR C-terminal-related transcriptional regulator n=1 Tax=Rhodococcus gannanensis TaxID=1960308 RepID=A0ABW4P8G4_9NOCA